MTAGPVLAIDWLPRRWTRDVLPIGGLIKQQPEDFEVEEIPAYQPGQPGEHLFLWIEKRDLSSPDLLQHVSTVLNVAARDIGIAGQKDRRAVTRQWISVPLRCGAGVSALESDRVRVLAVQPHSNKLRTGHLRGNRFRILIRQPRVVTPDELAAWEAALNQQGCANLFGLQRFGRDLENFTLGRDLLTGTSRRRLTRQQFRFVLSAAQSALFNAWVNARAQAGLLQSVLPGDVLQKCDSGGLFVAEDIEREQQRLSSREVTLAGPLFGPRMKPASGAAAELEDSVLQHSGLTRGDFARFPKLTSGTRRAASYFPADLSLQTVGADVLLQATLPPGSYATVLLAEIMGDELTASGADIEEDDAAAEAANVEES